MEFFYQLSKNSAVSSANAASAKWAEVQTTAALVTPVHFQSSLCFIFICSSWFFLSFNSNICWSGGSSSSLTCSSYTCNTISNYSLGTSFSCRSYLRSGSSSSWTINSSPVFNDKLVDLSSDTTIVSALSLQTSFLFLWPSLSAGSEISKLI